MRIPSDPVVCWAGWDGGDQGRKPSWAWWLTRLLVVWRRRSPWVGGGWAAHAAACGQRRRLMRPGWEVKGEGRRFAEKRSRGSPGRRRSTAGGPALGCPGRR